MTKYENRKLKRSDRCSNCGKQNKTVVAGGMVSLEGCSGSVVLGGQATDVTFIVADPGSSILLPLIIVIRRLKLMECLSAGILG